METTVKLFKVRDHHAKHCLPVNSLNRNKIIKVTIDSVVKDNPNLFDSFEVKLTSGKMETFPYSFCGHNHKNVFIPLWLYQKMEKEGRW